MRVGVGVQFGFWLSLLGVLAAALTGYYAYSESRIMLVESGGERLFTATSVMGRRFTVVLEEMGKYAALGAALPDVADLAGRTRDEAAGGRARARVAEVFAALLAQHPEFLQVRLIGVANHGRELVRVDHTAQGSVRVEGASLQEKGHYPYVYRTARLPAGAFYLSTINLNRERGTHAALDRPTVRVATPVHGADGAIYAVVVVNIDLDVLFSQLRSDLPASVQLYLTNQEGDYLLHPDESKTFGFDHGRRHRVQGDFAAVASVLDGSAGGMLLESDGNGGGAPRLASFVRVPFGAIAPDRFVVLGLGVPLSSALQGLDALGQRLAIIVVGFSLLAVIVSLFLSRLLVRPLDRIVTAVQRFSQGLPADSLPTQRGDEIGLLARSFENMSSQIGQQIDELQRYRGQLESLVEQRTAALTEAQREALRNERLAAIGQLTGTVSHELRNPMGTLRTSLAVLGKRLDGADAKVTQVLERMERSITRCDDIIEELLDYTRLRELELEETDLDNWLRDVLQEQDLPSGVDLATSLACGARCCVDRRRLGQAVVNVVQNACHALTESPVPCPRLTVTSTTRGERVVVVVADNGPGMKREVQERVFEPLFSTRAHGVGLGLPLVRRIVEQHHGAVEVDSAPRQGTRVTLLLPRHGRPGQSPATAARPGDHRP